MKGTGKLDDDRGPYRAVTGGGAVERPTLCMAGDAGGSICKFPHRPTT